MNLRIASFNIANGCYTKHDFSRIAADILEVKPDLVGLQEVDRFASRSCFVDTMSVLSEFTGMPYHAYAKAIALPGNSAVYGQCGEYGIGILSRYPIRQTKAERLPSDIYEQRVLLHVNVNINDILTDVFNTHLSFENADLRQKQMAFIHERMILKGNCLLTGDFNVEDMTEFARLSALASVLHEGNKPVTIPKEGNTIDNILYSDAFVCQASGILDNGHSDHVLLYADFEFEGN